MQVLQAVAKEKGLSVRDVQPGGNCALHALCDQLSLVGLSTDVSHLRRIAVDFLKTYVDFFDDDFLVKRQYKNRDAYLKQQAVAGHWCDEIMLSALAAHYDVEMNILHESGHTTKLCPPILNVQRILAYNITV